MRDRRRPQLKGDRQAVESRGPVPRRGLLVGSQVQLSVMALENRPCLQKNRKCGTRWAEPTLSAVAFIGVWRMTEGT